MISGDAFGRCGCTNNNCAGHSRIMTNKERAAQIWCHPKLGDRAMDAEMAFVIAEALDEAEERGHNLALSQREYRELKEAFIEGQKEMRERAAKRLSIYETDVEMIRALPIEGEIPEENKRMGCNHPGDICKA